MSADHPNEEPPPDGVIVWELDPEKPLTAYDDHASPSMVAAQDIGERHR
jgi:hypothetical protein